MKAENWQVRNRPFPVSSFWHCFDISFSLFSTHHCVALDNLYGPLVFYYASNPFQMLNACQSIEDLHKDVVSTVGGGGLQTR